MTAIPMNEYIKYGVMYIFFYARIIYHFVDFFIL